MKDEDVISIFKDARLKAVIGRMNLAFEIYGEPLEIGYKWCCYIEKSNDRWCVHAPPIPTPGPGVKLKAPSLPEAVSLVIYLFNNREYLDSDSCNVSESIEKLFSEWGRTS